MRDSGTTIPFPYENELARLENVIADAEWRIERQRELIQSTVARGLPTDDVSQTLDAMLNVLETLQHYRAAILRLRKGRLH